MKVCRYDQGNTPLFTCPYHNWSYATDGRLVGVPMHKELYPDLDRSEWSLIEVPRMVNYKGAIFASWDPQAPEFVDYLGDAKDHLDQVLDCRDGREGGSEVFGGVHKWIIPANWKFAAENFCGDTYHNPSHRSVDLIGIGPSSAKGGTAGRRDNEYQGGRHVWVSFPSGHGVHSVWMPPNPPYVETFQDNRIVADYFRHCYHERTRRLGDKARLLPFTGTIFPNASYHGRQPRALCVWHPVSATQTEVWRFFPGRSRRARRGQGPAAALLHALRRSGRDDRAGRYGELELRDGRQPRHDRAALSLQLPGLARDRARDNDPVPGNVSTQVTEENARGFYRSWQRYLDGADWPALIGRPARQETRAAAE